MINNSHTCLINRSTLLPTKTGACCIAATLVVGIIGTTIGILAILAVTNQLPISMLHNFNCLKIGGSIALTTAFATLTVSTIVLTTWIYVKSRQKISSSDTLAKKIP